MRKLFRATADVTIGFVYPVGEFSLGGLCFWVLRAEHPLEDEQERGVLVAGPGCIPRLPRPVGEASPFGEGVGVLGEGDPVADRQ